MLKTPEVEAYLRKAADPAAVEAGLQRLVEAGADPRPHLEGWMRLLDASPLAADALARRPALVAEIPLRGGAYDRAEFERGLAEALRTLPDLRSKVDHLRAVRVEETLRIAWQDVVEGADLTVVTRRISDLADIVIESLLALVSSELERQFGRPREGGFAVLAMGKLGGAELNYASDIDLVYLYGKDGETEGGPGGRSLSHREFYHRLAERVTREANAVTPMGRLYRVDLRLRPEGQTGSLALSLASTLAYYERTGETWERQALLKARVIAGDRSVGDAFVSSVREWVFGRGLDFEEIAAIKRIKQRIEDATIVRGEERREVKLGYGGIRDVEYVIQFLQLLHGAKNPEVRHHNSLTALRLLEKAGAILPLERDVLDDAYRFLRLVEHRLQLVQGAQVHRIPVEEPAITALAKRCGFKGALPFHDAYRARAEAVRRVFEKLFKNLFAARDEAEKGEIDLVLAGAGDTARVAEVLAAHGIADTLRGAQAVADLARETSAMLAGSPRTRKFLANLFPRLLDLVAATPDPDGTLVRLEAITAGVGARATLYEAMGADERLLRLLVDLAAGSRFLCNILERAPDTLDQLVDALATEAGRGLASFEDIPTATVPTAPDPARILSDYKNLEILRIGLRDVRGEQTVKETGEDLTRLAEVILRLAYERARSEARAAGADLVVVALGKLGSGELLFGSDLDLVYFARDAAHLAGATAVARRLASILGTPGPHGRLYEVDLRLRPEGEKGPLMATPASLREYFASGNGQTWERMAYTRARAVAGPPTLCEEVMAVVADTVYPPGFGAADAAAMKDMRERLARKGGPQSIKRGGSGGVVDVEFVVQMHALARGRRDSRFRVGNVPKLLALLRDGQALDAQRAADLHAAYVFLLALENRIRIVSDLPEDRLPEDPREVRSLARRLGYVDVGDVGAEVSLKDEYAYHKDVAARAFRETIEGFGGC